MILAGLAVVLLFLSRTWTEVLWFSQLGFSRVVWTQWIAAGAMFIVGTLIMFLAVLAAMTRAYRAREITLPYDEASDLHRAGAAGCLRCRAGAGPALA